LYILDEPSIDFTQRHRKADWVLQKLRDLGNTVIVVEHDEDIMKAADMLIDIGPYAGTNGGEIMFEGTSKNQQRYKKPYRLYINGIEKIEVRRNEENGTTFSSYRCKETTSRILM
jgi:excinuclease ABC subunit A